MGKYRYHVKLRNGEEYLCDTLAEAKALESGHLPMRKQVDQRIAAVRNRSGFGGVLPTQNLTQNPKMRTGRGGFAAPLKQYSDPRQKWFREIVQNSTGKGVGTTEIRFQTNNVEGATPVTSARDNGKGMTPEILLDKFLVSGGTSKGVDEVGGFGIAKELILWPWGRWAVVTKTKKGKTLYALGVGETYDYYEDGQGPFYVEEGFDSRGEPEANIDRSDIVTKERGTPTLAEAGTEHFANDESGTYIKIWGDNETLPQSVDAFAFLTYCTLPNVEVTVNGKKLLMNYKPPTTGGGIVKKKIPSPIESYVNGTLYYNPRRGSINEDGGGVLLVRAGSMLTWKAPFPQGCFLVEVTGDTKYLLNAQRDNWADGADSHWARWINTLTNMVKTDPSSIGVNSTTFDKEYRGATDAGQADVNDAIADEMWKETQKSAENAKKIKDKKAREQAEQDVAEGAARRLEQQQQEQQQQDEDESRKEDQRQRSEDQQRREGGKKVSKEEQSRREEGAAKRIERRLGRSSVSNTADLLSKSAQGAWDAKLKLATWAPPLRISNTIEGWTLTKEFKPATMSHKNLMVLKVWTVLLKRMLGTLGCFDHRFGVGFILSSERLAQAGRGSRIPVTFYQINPFVSMSETREGELPKSWVSQSASIEAGAADTIPIDPYKPRHVAIMAGRLLHELVHGVYGEPHHYQQFASILTSLVSAIGDKMGDIIAAGIAATADERPPARGATPASAAHEGERTKSGRKVPVRADLSTGRDPRLPPVGTVLRRDGLTVVVGQGNEVYVTGPTEYVLRGQYASLSAAVKKFLKLETYNGFQWFSLKDYPAKPCRYCVGTLDSEGMYDLEQAAGRPKGPIRVQ